MFVNNAFNIEINKYRIGVIEMSLLVKVRDVIRKKHYSIRTEQAYINWIRQYILFHRKRHQKIWEKRKFLNTFPTWQLTGRLLRAPKTRL